MESVRRRVLNVENWLASYAPDSAKFVVQETMLDVMKNLSDEQRAELRWLASHIHAGVAAKNLHDLVYAVSEIRHLCKQDVSGDLHIHRKAIRSESRTLHGVSGPGVFCWIGCGWLVVDE